MNIKGICFALIFVFVISLASSTVYSDCNTYGNCEEGETNIDISLFGNISGSGTINTIPKWTSENGLGDSKFTDDGSTPKYNLLNIPRIDTSLVIGDIPFFSSTNGKIKTSSLFKYSTSILSVPNIVLSGSILSYANAPTGVDNSVLIKDSDNFIKTDEIDPRVWGNNLAIYSGGGNQQVAYFSETAGQLTGESVFVYDYGSNFLGIGTSDPLDVGHFQGEDPFILIQNGARTQTEVGLKFLDDKGNQVGLFKQNGSSKKLEISASSSTSPQFIFDATVPAFEITGVTPTLILTDTSEGANDFEIKVNHDALEIQDTTASTTPLTIKDAAPTNSIYVNADGEVGIGTNNPLTSLYVVGNLTVEGNLNVTGCIHYNGGTLGSCI